MPFIPLESWLTASAHLQNAPDGTKLPRSLNKDGSRRLKNNQPVSTDYDTQHSFIRLHGTTYMLQATLGRGGNARIKRITRAHETVPQVVKIENAPFHLMEVSINRALGRVKGPVARIDRRKHYLPMPFLGDNLFRLLAEKRLSDTERREVAIKLCIEAFHLHHGQPGKMIPIAHLDIKPENITLKDGKLFFIDFGTSAVQPASLQYYFYSTHLYRPESNAVMTGEMYDMIALRRTLWMPETLHCMDGHVRSPITMSLLRQEDFIGTPLEKWLDTSAIACPTPESFIERHQPAYILAAMLIAHFYQLDIDIAALPCNPWLCLLLIELFERKETSESMQSTLENPEVFLRAIFREKFTADRDWQTLKPCYLFERLHIPPSTHVITHAEALFGVAQIPGFLPHLHRLSCPDCAFLLPILTQPDNGFLVEKIRIILDSVPASDNQWLLYRLGRVVKDTPVMLQRVTLLQEKALHILYKNQITSPIAVTSPLVIIRLDAVNLLAQLDTIRRYEEIHAFLRGKEVYAYFLDSLRYVLNIPSEERREKLLSNLNDCPAAWNILFTKDIRPPSEAIPRPLLRALVYCNVPQFDQADYRYHASLILRFPEKHAQMLEHTLAFLRERTPETLHDWVRLIMTHPHQEEGMEYLYFANVLREHAAGPEKLLSFLRFFCRIEALKTSLPDAHLERLNLLKMRFRQRVEKIEPSSEADVAGIMQKLFTEIHSFLGNIPLKTKRLNPMLKVTCSLLLQSVNTLRPDYQPSYPPGFFRKRIERSEPQQPGLAETRQRLT